MIPDLDTDGNLPPGIHHATWTEIVTRYATSTRRRELLDGLLDALRSLKAAHCKIAYIDGSLITAKEHPGDFDACWEAAGVASSRLDPELLDFSDGRSAQKARYGESCSRPRPPPSQTAQPFSSSSNATGSPNNPKGTIAIDLTGLP
jgi:hypothetical protein